MLASTQFDMCMGLDIHLEMVPVPPAPLPVPMPFPMPFVGQIEFSPSGVLISVGIAAGMQALSGEPAKGPVLVNCLQSTKTGDEATNKKTMPHMVIKPGLEWTPLPKPLKLKVKPDAEVTPDSPASPPGDAVMVTGSSTVYFEGSNACTIGTLAMSCSDPVRMPLSMLLAIPKGLPVLACGMPTLDWKTAAKTFLCRNKWMAGLLNQLVSRLPPGRLRSLFGWLACELTGHPVDVATGRLLTHAEDFELRGPIPLKFERYYSTAWAERDSPLGYGWSHTFDERVWVERGRVVYKMGDGRELEFHTHDLPGRRMRAGQELTYRLSLDRFTLRFVSEGHWEIRTPDGLTRSFEGDRSGTAYLKRIVNRLGQWVAFEYESGERLSGVRTSEGRWARLEHRNGRLQRIALPYPGGDAAGWYDRVTFAYSENGDLISATDSQKHARTFCYEHHLMVQETDRDGLTYYFEFDGRDSTASCVRTWGSDGRGEDRLLFREITYDKKNRRTFVEDSLGNTTTYEMNEANAVVKIVDPLAGERVFEYDENLRCVAETNAVGGRSERGFDARGNENVRRLPAGGFSKMTYSTADELVSVVDPLGLRWDWTYDMRGRVVAFSNSSGDGVRLEYGNSPYPSRMIRNDGQWLSLEHDAYGNIVSMRDATGVIEESRYDRAGLLVRLRDGAGLTTRSYYDLEERVCRIDTPGNVVRQLAYTPEGDLAIDERVDGTTTYAYANNHQLVTRSDASGRVAMRYDSESRLRALTNQAGETYRQERDARGDVVEATAFDGRTSRYQIDAARRVVALFGPAGSASTLEYDLEGNVRRVVHADNTEENYSYDAGGHLIEAKNADATVKIVRDARGLVVRESIGDDWVDSAWNARSQRVGIWSARGLVEGITRSPSGQVVGVAVWDSSTTATRTAKAWETRFLRDDVGAVVARSFPATGVSAGVRTSYDSLGRTSQTTIFRGAEALSQTDYAWGPPLELLSRTDRAFGKTEYVRDENRQLAGATTARGGADWRSPTPSGDVFKQRDRSDRRYGKGGVLLEDDKATYAYDAEGNVIEKRERGCGTWKYAWSGGGRLKEVVRADGTRITFTYDALGRRLSKTVGDERTRWVWDGNALLHEIKESVDGASDARLTTWLTDPDNMAPLAKLGDDGRKLSVVTDYLGTPTEMVDEAGRLAWKAQLDIYGVPDVAVGDRADCPWRWPGQFEDPETGLYYNRFRYYDPERGNYLSPDPLGITGDLSTYAYVHDPTVQFDPFGLIVDGHHPVPKALLQGLVDAGALKQSTFDKLKNQRPSGAIRDGIFAAERAAHVDTHKGLSAFLNSQYALSLRNGFQHKDDWEAYIKAAEKQNGKKNLLKTVLDDLRAFYHGTPPGLNAAERKAAKDAFDKEEKNIKACQGAK